MHDGYGVHALGYQPLRHLSMYFPFGEGSFLSRKINIVDGRPVVRPGIPGTIVTVKAPRACIAAIVRSAESNKAAQTGAKEIRLLSGLSDKRRQRYDFFA